MSGPPGTLVYARGFFKEICSWRGFCDEGKSAVRLDGNQGRNGDTGPYVRSASVEFFTKVHGLHATGTKSRTDRWRGSRLASRDEETLRDPNEARRSVQRSVQERKTHNYLCLCIEGCF